MTAPGMTLSLPEQIEQIKRAVERQKQAEDNLRREQPLLRFWDAEWRLQHVGGVEVKAQFSWVSNDTGPGQVELPLDSPVAQWIHDHVGRLQRGEGRNVGITVDYCGARWSGIMDKYVVEQREDGDTVLIVDFMHDYEHLKWVSVWSNPWLPAAFQAPRAFVLAGPVDWCLKTALLANLTREHNPFVTWPDDPLDPAGWLQPWMDVSKWHMVVKPTSFIESMESGIVWGVLTSRWATWHDMAKTMLEDSELSVRCDRWLEGDPPPWEGAKLRNGCLVIDIVDKSGVYIGTSHGGTLADGLIRTVAEFSDDFVDSTVNLAEDTETPQDYFRIGHKYTDKVLPYVVFREGDTSPIQSSQWIYSPSKGIQVNVGGHSMPGVNETISASVQAVGDIVGNVVMIGGLGGSLDTMLKPIYEDTILAWQSVKSSERAQNSGWERLFEYFQQGAQQAYTIASTIVLRAGFWATKTTISWKVQVADGLPYLIGDRGKGHFFLDDRVGLVLKGDTTIHMDRARKLDLAWDETNPPEWAITIGDDRNLQDPAQRAFGKIETLVAGLRDLGVWTGVVVAGFSAAAALALTLGGQPAESTTTGASGANVGVLGGEFMPSHAMSLEAVPAISGGLTEHALYLPAVQTAGSTHPRPAGADIRVLRSELMASHTVGLGGVPVGSMTNLVDRVFALSAPGEVGQSIVGPFPV